MSTWFVTRHYGAKEWAAREGFQVDAIVEHLDTEAIRTGDTVIGALPVHLAAEVCRQGARYLHLQLELPPDLRGAELSAAEMADLGARLAEFRVEAIQPGKSRA